MFKGFSPSIVEVSEGRKALSVPYMVISDQHFGTPWTRAEMICHMLQHVQAQRLDCNGDLMGGDEMRDNRVWKGFHPFQRQTMAEIIKRPAMGLETNFFPGNHDAALRGEDVIIDGQTVRQRALIGKRLYGVQVEEQGEYEGTDGKRYLVIHGDQPGTYDNARPLSLGEHFTHAAYNAFYNFSSVLQSSRLTEDFSLAASIKNALRPVMRQRMPVHDYIAGLATQDRYDGGVVWGHLHWSGIDQLADGKLSINSGCGTEHCSAAAQDADGNWAVLEWHRSYLAVTAQDGIRQKKTWAELGLPEFVEDVRLEESKFTRRADRLMGAAYLIWPPREGRQLMRAYQDAVAEFRRNSGDGPLTAELQQTLNDLRLQRKSLVSLRPAPS